MFASQLLKILQTLPSDLKYESCVFDLAEQNMTMKENDNQNATFFDSKSFRRETDPLTFVSKEIYESNDSRLNVDPLAFETKVRDENRKGIDDISMDNKSGTIDSPRKDNENGLSDHVNVWEKDSDTLSSDMHDKDKKQISPDHESSVTVEEFTLFNGNEYIDSSSQCDGASDLFETVTNVFTDKNVLECELPELEVMKDICVDDGRLEKDKYSIESFKDDKSLSVENAKSHTANQCEIKEYNDGKLVDQERYTGMVVIRISSSEKDIAKHCDPPELVQTGEADCTATNSSEEDSLVDKKLPIQEYGTQRTFLKSLDGEGNKLTQPPDQIPIEKAVSEGPTSSSVKAVSEGPTSSSVKAGGLEEGVQASNPLYNSKVETGSITLNFSDTRQVQCSNGSSANSKIQCVSSKDSHDESVCEQQKDGSSDDISSDGQVQSPSDKSQCSTNDDAPAVELNDAKQERGNLGNDTAVSQWQYDQGETSFSAVMYSGPIAFSGSLSHRSDASTTSARSFAFPILQSEWNSSPVRMAKAERRHFRKQKGWRSGILCCRF